MNKFMKAAIKEAEIGMNSGEGGPFGAFIVKDNKIIAKAHNEVLKTHDPTAHAEIQAIRKASKKLKTFDLSECELYTTCEPCPMCFAAIHWAKIKKLYYGCTAKDAAQIGFDDKYIYDVIKGKAKDNLRQIQIDHEQCMVPFTEWMKKKNRTQY